MMHITSTDVQGSIDGPFIRVRVCVSMYVKLLPLSPAPPPTSVASALHQPLPRIGCTALFELFISSVRALAIMRIKVLRYRRALIGWCLDPRRALGLV
jgi:hypothetical protein